MNGRPLFALWLALALAIPVGCTITPRQVKPSSASFDGSHQNSGFIGFDADGSGIISDGARQRYDALCRKFGKRFLVPIRPGDGISVGPIMAGVPTWKITPQRLVDFQTMMRWHRAGL